MSRNLIEHYSKMNLLARFFILTLAACTAVTALHCDQCSEQMAGSNSALLKRTNLADNNTETHPPYRPKTWEEEVHMDNWREYTWPPKSRGSWPKRMARDFYEVVMPHLPDDIQLHSPLLPTNDEKLKDVYKRAVTEAALQNMKSAAQKRLEFARLRKESKEFMEASYCEATGKCGLDWGRNAWRESYNARREALKYQTELEGLAKLGKELSELGFPESQLRV